MPGASGQPIYYGTDQLGSVRRAFVAAGNAPAYSYDPYGNALQATAPVTEFGYAGMLHEPDSGLYLTQYRAYDPVAGRWLSRDPIGEASDPAGNLYAYVQGNPVSLTDPLGLYVDAMGGYYPDEPCPGFDYNPLEHPYITGGMAAGVLAAPFVSAFAIEGAEIVVGSSFRFAPFGNRTGNPFGRWTHYHRRGVDPATGKTNPGQGIGRHRPWETKSTDTSFWDRF